MSEYEIYKKHGVVKENGAVLEGTPYVDCYYLIIKAIEEVRKAKCLILQGESPYIALSFAENLCAEARAKWHAIKEREETDGKSN